MKAYLNNLKVIDDENQLHNMSLEIEGPASTLGSSIGSGSQQSMFSNVGSVSLPGSASTSRSRRHVSPAPSTTSSTTSTTSEDRKVNGNKFGAASPQAVRKLLSLAEPGKTRPHQPKQLPAPTLPSMILQPSPIARRAPNAISIQLFINVLQGVDRVDRVTFTDKGSILSVTPGIASNFGLMVGPYFR